MIKQNSFQMGDLVLLYDSKFLKHLGKFNKNWMGPYVIQRMTDVCIVQLRNLEDI